MRREEGKDEDIKKKLVAAQGKSGCDGVRGGIQLRPG